AQSRMPTLGWRIGRSSTSRRSRSARGAWDRVPRSPKSPMMPPVRRFLALGATFSCGLLGCSSGDGSKGGTGEPSCPAAPDRIEHVVVLVQENHTFDTYFGSYCTAKPGSNPSCTEGPACCEAAP